MSEGTRGRGTHCLFCKQPLPAASVRGRRQLYCSDRCLRAGQRWQQTQTGTGAGGRQAPKKGQTKHGQGTTTHKPRDLKADDVGVA